MALTRYILVGAAVRLDFVQTPEAVVDFNISICRSTRVMTDSVAEFSGLLKYCVTVIIRQLLKNL